MVIIGFLDFLFMFFKKILLLNYFSSHLNKSKKTLNFKILYFLSKFFRNFFKISKKIDLKFNTLFILVTSNKKNGTSITHKNKKLTNRYIIKHAKEVYELKKLKFAPHFNDLKKNYQVLSVLKSTIKSNLSMINISFLRKFRVFNKGRYSRNRQFYRTGVYWCLYINIIAVIGIYFWFYKITINYNYMWIILYFFFASIIWSRFFNFFSFKNIFFFLKWNFSLFNSLKSYTLVILLNLYFKIKLLFII